jgi:hypothetical protein
MATPLEFNIIIFEIKKSFYFEQYIHPLVGRCTKAAHILTWENASACFIEASIGTACLYKLAD